MKHLRTQSGGSFTADNFRGNGALTILYPTPDWLLSKPLESQGIIDVLELFRSRGGGGAHISVKLPQLSYGKCIRWDIGCVCVLFIDQEDVSIYK